jgi:branched-chain amino acid transport system ATP-binding protein
MLRALIMNPRLLLLDEPTEGVAPIITERIVKFIKTLNEEEKLTILWVEPGAKLKKVLEVADKIAVITAGRLIYVEEVEKARKEIDNIQRLLFV